MFDIGKIVGYTEKDKTVFDKFGRIMIYWGTLHWKTLIMFFFLMLVDSLALTILMWMLGLIGIR